MYSLLFISANYNVQWIKDAKEVFTLFFFCKIIFQDLHFCVTRPTCISYYMHLDLIPGSSSVCGLREVYKVESFHSNRLAVTDQARSKWVPWQRRSSERLLQMNMTPPYPVLTWLHCNCLLHQSLSPCGKGLLVDGQKALSIGPIHSAEIHRSDAHSLSRLITPATAHGPGLAFNALIFTLRSTTATYARKRKRHGRYFRCGSEELSFSSWRYYFSPQERS